ncbi:hypothetical protein SUGI_0128720 [Cryptomeria japonica]|nr:hypothetical protein SUGI_0128720 [Cryptomeria japonica]
MTRRAGREGRSRYYQILSHCLRGLIACTASPLPPQKQTVNGPGILCDPCGGAGWVVCDFCEGQKTNVKARNNRLYRRCPSCRATGFLICQKCRVFKCVTFPSDRDSVSEF